MPKKSSGRNAVTMPRGVHVVAAKGRLYYYFQPGRGTGHIGPRIRLPRDPSTPEFWAAIRAAQGQDKGKPTDRISGLLAAFVASASPRIGPSTRYQYERMCAIAAKLWGDLPPDGLTPDVMQEVVDQMADTPAKANLFLGTMKTASAWARKRKLITQSWTDGVERYKLDTGHKPWTPEQVRAIDRFEGTVRRGIMLYLYTGQRGSDVVRLGWTDIDEGGFTIRQKKTKRAVWCPILPELAKEMATWEKRPGPFLQQDNGRPYDRRLFWLHFKQAAKDVPELAGVTLHGLRCTALINLRRQGLELGQIQDIVGMSLPMIQRYCRFADMKASGQAALISLTERRRASK